MNTIRSAFLLIAAAVGAVVAAEDAVAQIVSPTGQFPPPPGVPLFDLSTEFGRYAYSRYMYQQYVMTRLKPIYARHIGEPAWVASWQYLLAGGGLGNPTVAENGDIMGLDNDGRGSPEPVFVEGYYESDGSYVRSHFRALPDFGERGF